MIGDARDKEFDATAWANLGKSIQVDASAFDARARERIERHIFWARYSFANKPTPARDVIRALKRMDKGLEPGTDTASRLAMYAFDADRKDERGRIRKSVTPKMVSEMRRPAPKMGRPLGDPRFRHLIDALATELELATKTKLSKSGFYRSGCGVRAGKPAGKLLNFVRHILSYVPEAPDVTDEELAHMFRTRRRRSLKNGTLLPF